MTDAKAFIGWLDQQASVAKNRKIGTQGYCMGGFLAFRTAATVPDRVGAVATFHGGELVANYAEQPALQAAKSKAQFLIAIAANDDKQAPNDKNVLKETFAKASLPAEIEVYTAPPRLVSAGYERLQRWSRPRRPGAACSRCTEKLSANCAKRNAAAAVSIQVRTPPRPLRSLNINSRLASFPCGRSPKRSRELWHRPFSGRVLW